MEEEVELINEKDFLIAKIPKKHQIISIVCKEKKFYVNYNCRKNAVKEITKFKIIPVESEEKNFNKTYKLSCKKTKKDKYIGFYRILDENRENINFCFFEEK
jgi:hypothetical protein